jgi:putative restriction endonuclease
VTAERAHSAAVQAELRAAAIAHVKGLERAKGVLSWQDIAEGFDFRGERVLLANKPRGIFWPAGLVTGALSIKTSVPRAGRQRRYDDNVGGDAPYFRYKYQGTRAEERDNVGLRKCLRDGLPVIYFFGIWEALYRPIICRIVHEDPSAHEFRAVPIDEVLAGAAGEPEDASKPRMFERRYAIAETRRRLHQDRFREAVLDAYSSQCAICRLRHSRLLDAAHIIPDAERLGEAKVPNGLSLCKLHHAAFDANMLGIRPEGVVELRRELLEERDGPMLEHGLRAFHGSALQLPRSPADRPDPELLQERWRRFAA